MRASVLIAALLLGAASAHAEEATVPLHHRDPQAIVAKLKPAPGLEKITLGLKDKAITLTGTAEAVRAAQDDITRLDVPVRGYSLATKLVRVQVDAQGKAAETVVASPVLSAMEEVAATVTTRQVDNGASIILTPVPNADGTVTLIAELRDLDELGKVTGSARAERRLRPGETARILGVTSAEDTALRWAVREGQTVTDRGPYAALYLDVTVAPIAPATGR